MKRYFVRIAAIALIAGGSVVVPAEVASATPISQVQVYKNGRSSASDCWWATVMGMKYWDGWAYETACNLPHRR